jgi:hypothetical protein
VAVPQIEDWKNLAELRKVQEDQLFSGVAQGRRSVAQNYLADWYRGRHDRTRRYVIAEEPHVVQDFRVALSYSRAGWISCGRGASCRRPTNERRIAMHGDMVHQYLRPE